MSSDKQEKYIRKVTRVGRRSLSIVIPAEIADEMDIRERQKMSIYRIGNSIVIEDHR